MDSLLLYVGCHEDLSEARLSSVEPHAIERLYPSPFSNLSYSYDLICFLIAFCVDSFDLFWVWYQKMRWQAQTHQRFVSFIDWILSHCLYLILLGFMNQYRCILHEAAKACHQSWIDMALLLVCWIDYLRSWPNLDCWLSYFYLFDLVIFFLNWSWCSFHWAYPPLKT